MSHACMHANCNGWNDRCIRFDIQRKVYAYGCSLFSQASNMACRIFDEKLFEIESSGGVGCERQNIQSNRRVCRLESDINITKWYKNSFLGFEEQMEQLA